jgi:YHS domain-containing protein
MMNRDQSQQNQSGLDPEVQQALNPNPQRLSAGGDVAMDPVCGMLVDKRTAKDTISASAGTNNETLYFCSADCKALFEQQPEQYGYPNY